MGRWIAIGRNHAWEDRATFRSDLGKVDTWRPDPRVTVTSVFMLGDGRLIAECHAPRREQFEQWLASRGWQDVECTVITDVARMGGVWDVS